MNTILITGASGFIGTELCEHLASRQFNVIGVDNRGENDRLGKIVKNYHHYKVNLTEEDAIADLFDKIPHPDVIIHLAGITRVRTARDNPVASIEANISATIKIFLAYQNNSQIKSKRGSFLLISTNELDNISRHLGTPSIYSITKQCAEDLVKSLHKPNVINASILRLCTVYGGEMELKDKLPRIFIEKAIRKERLVINSNAKFNPSFIFIDDLLELIHGISVDLMSASEVLKFETLAVTGEEASLREIVDHIQDISGSSIKFSYEDIDDEKREPGRQHISYEYRSVRHGDPISLKDGLRMLWHISKKQS